MAINPQIPLAVKPFEAPRVLESAQRVMTLKDSVDQSRIRQVQEKTAQIQQEQASLHLEEAKKDKAFDDLVGKHTTWDNGPKYNDTAIATEALAAGMGNRLTAWGEYRDKRYVADLAKGKAALQAHHDQAVERGRQAELVDSLPAYVAFRMQHPELNLPEEFDPKNLDPIKNEAESVKKYALSAIERVSYDEKRSQLPENQKVTLAGLNARAAEQYGVPVDKLPQRVLDANFEKATGVKVDRVAATADKKLTTMPAALVPPDAVDINNNPIPDSWRAEGRQISQHQASDGRVYYTPDVNEKKPQESADVRAQKLTEAAYGERVLNKKWEDMSPGEKNDSVVWMKKIVAGANPTDLQIKIDLAQRNPELFETVTGIEGRAFILHQRQTGDAIQDVTRMIQAANSNTGMDPKEAKEFWDRQRAVRSQIGIDIGDYNSTYKEPEPKPKAAPAAAAPAKKIAKKADVQTAATKRGITFDEMKKLVEAAGGTVE